MPASYCWAGETEYRLIQSPLFSPATNGILEFLSGREPGDFRRRNAHRFSGGRISPLARLTLGHGKRPKTNQGDLVTFFQRPGHSIGESVHRFLRCCLSESCILGHIRHKFALVHWITPFALFIQRFSTHHSIYKTSIVLSIGNVTNYSPKPLFSKIFCHSPTHLARFRGKLNPHWLAPLLPLMYPHRR